VGLAVGVVDAGDEVLGVGVGLLAARLADDHEAVAAGQRAYQDARAPQELLQGVLQAGGGVAGIGHEGVEVQGSKSGEQAVAQGPLGQGPEHDRAAEVEVALGHGVIPQRRDGCV
jgi:hypothetical protein